VKGLTPIDSTKEEERREMLNIVKLNKVNKELKVSKAQRQYLLNQKPNEVNGLSSSCIASRVTPK
jgi:DNA primase catalytic subunit